MNDCLVWHKVINFKHSPRIELITVVVIDIS